MFDLILGVEMKHQMLGQAGANGLVPIIDKNNCGYGNMDKKKRLTSEQLDSLETSFQEETKLEPDRKMKLAQELGLQPRQVAVWFQNRRARWKAKQLERLYDALKHEYDVVSNEKQKLQEEVLALRAILKEQATRNQVSGGYTEISGEETVESTSAAAIRSSNRLPPPLPPPQGTSNHHETITDQANYVFTVDNYNQVVPPAYWGVLPSYPLN
ncbi:hypothetical protein LguiA_032414 [Lonicera macranthoides]